MIVIPANAGVILSIFAWTLPDSSYPRECGGDPKLIGEGDVYDVVIPANAGVIL